MYGKCVFFIMVLLGGGIFDQLPHTPTDTDHVDEPRHSNRMCMDTLVVQTLDLGFRVQGFRGLGFIGFVGFTACRVTGLLGSCFIGLRAYRV